MDTLEGNIWGFLGPSQVSTKRERIATLAREMPDQAIHSLSRHLDEDWLLTACAKTRKDGAAGIDQETWADFAGNILERLTSLRDRAHSGSYFAPPVRRVYIPKRTGSETRPIGIPTFEDKVLQRAVVMLLEPIYEGTFHAGSFGFRPGRNAHQAIDALRNWLVRHGGGWVMEDGFLTHPTEGSPQGGVISPLLANIYLHCVLDEWFETEVKPA